MEWILGKVGEKEIDGTKVREIGGVHVCTNPTCEVCRIFGTSADSKRKRGKGRRSNAFDCQRCLSFEETRKDQKYVKDDVFITELKTENTLNRITSAANPRSMERVRKAPNSILK